ARAHRQPHHLAEHVGDLVAGNVVHGGDDHRSASLLRTSHARRTSASVVLALPIARRRTYRPSSFVCVMNISPEALTRLSNSSFSASVPSRRKTTRENRC